MKEKTFENLRKLHPNFFFHRYEYQVTEKELKVTYHFEIENLASFSPTWTFPLRFKEKKISLEHPMFKRLLFCLGMIELISYWKITASPCVKILASRLNQKEIDFFKQVYWHGLGEYFYENKIQTSYETFLSLDAKPREKEAFLLSLGCPCCIHLPEPEEKALLPIGGGKDSIVSLELLKKLQMPFRTYALKANEAISATVQVGGVKEAVEVTRTIDEKMLRLNKEGYLNGHTPFSALLAFSSLLVAYLHNEKYIVLSNENSANEASVHGTDINHQWSKSTQFEKLFQDFCQNCLGVHQKYFSLLRPYSELRIAFEFSKHKPYHKVFKSCNRGSKTAVWCNACAKCLFVNILLFPFLSLEERKNIFGKDLFEEESLLPIFKDLLGATEQKPFECVGTVEEVVLALEEGLSKHYTSDDALPILLAFYQQHKKELLIQNTKHDFQNCLKEDAFFVKDLPELFQSLFTKELF